MKIHNYGNDYAYQQKRKSMESEKAQVKAEEAEKKEVPVQEPEKEMIVNAGNQIQTGGEREVEEPGTQEVGQFGELAEKETGILPTEGTGEEAREEAEEKPAIHQKKKK